MAKKTKADEKFDNRTRFNWGYHDAAKTVREGWNNVEKNFGFGPALKVSCVRDVLTQHADKAYAQGWQFGYHAAEDGTYEGNSESAWQHATGLGLVA